MGKKTAWGIAVCVMVGALVLSQQMVRTAPTLTAEDYIEIQQLYTRYNFGIDTHADEGGMWAGTFTADGVFDAGLPSGPVQGRAALAEFAKAGDGAAPLSPRHFVTNIMIEPTADGAVGSAYFFMVTDAESGAPATVGSKGVYHDALVKTADGWRFAKRTFVPGGFPDALVE